MPCRRLHRCRVSSLWTRGGVRRFCLVWVLTAAVPPTRRDAHPEAYGPRGRTCQPRVPPAGQGTAVPLQLRAYPFIFSSSLLFFLPIPVFKLLVCRLVSFSRHGGSARLLVFSGSFLCTLFGERREIRAMIDTACSLLAGDPHAARQAGAPAKARGDVPGRRC